MIGTRSTMITMITGGAMLTVLTGGARTREGTMTGTRTYPGLMHRGG